MSEQWRQIPGWEGLYSVSNGGRVRSEERVIVMGNGHTRRLKQRFLRPGVTGTGHLIVFLCQAPTRRVCATVHTLVLEAFVGPRPVGMESLHWDDDPSNNTLSNLRYGTRSENLRDAARNGKHPWANRTHCPRNHPYDEANTFINVRGSRECRTCNRNRQRKAQVEI